MNKTAWTDHLDGLAKLEDNIGKRVAFETSSEIIQKLEQELADLKYTGDSSKPCPDGVCEFNAYNKHVTALRKENADLMKELSELKSSLPKLRAEAVRGAIEDYKNEYVGQGIEALLGSYADKLEAGYE